MDIVVLARQLRLAVVTDVLRQGLMTETKAKEVLSGPLSPDDGDSVYDDSVLLGDPDALDKIVSNCKEE